MKPELILFLISLFCFSCSGEKYKENNLGIAVKSIELGSLKSDLKKRKYQEFMVDWKNPSFYESDCATYNIIPKIDTFQYSYFLDFCNDELIWISYNEKSVIDWTNQKECLKNIRKFKNNDSSKTKLVDNFYKEGDRLYYCTCEHDVGIVYHEVQHDVDLATWNVLGSFAVDKNKVYSFYLMSSGLKIHELAIADKETFEVFNGTMYAKDKNNVYYSRNGIIDNADLNSFKPLDAIALETDIPLAKDNKRLYMWDEVLTDTSVINGLEEYLAN